MILYPEYFLGNAKVRELQHERRALYKEITSYIASKKPLLESIASLVTEHEMLAAVHEGLVLRQMQRQYQRGDQKSFWKNQKRFLAFLDMESPKDLLGKVKHGYHIGHAWLVSRNKKYQQVFQELAGSELSVKREDNWQRYNALCEEMHRKHPRYESLDSILINYRR
jgi:hypothetical protein